MSTNDLKKSDFDEICRICLQKQFNYMLSVYKPEILQMYRSFTSIEFNDELPSQICSNCFSKMTESYNFKELCESSNRLLLKILESYEDIPEQNLYNSLEDTDLKFEENFKLISEISDNEEDCKRDIYDNSSLDRWSMDDVPLSKRNTSKLDINKCDPATLTCKTCNKCLSTVVSLQRHLKTHEECKFICKICNKGFHEEGHLLNHIKRHEEGTKYQCEFCTASFFEISSLATHVGKKHNTEPIPCGECNKKFIIQLQLDAHMKVHSTEKDHICPVCGKGFYKRHLLRKHQKHHATERIYHCMQCDKSFRVDATLRLHYKRCHSGEKKKEVCTICGKSVLNIKAHQNTHNSEKPFKCSECPKEFSNKYNLEEHRKRKHGNPEEATKRPYLCSICGKGSVSTTALKTHFQHMHTVGKTYPCPICNKKFKTDKAVNAHVKYTHNDDRRYGCTVCMKSFQTSTILKIHMRVHTGERPFACKLCGKAFGQASTLKTHMKVHGFETEKNNKSDSNVEKNENVQTFLTTL